MGQKYSLSGSSDIAKRILKAVGIDGLAVSRLNMAIDPCEAIKFQIELYPTSEQLEELAEAFESRSYVLVELAQEPPVKMDNEATPH